MSLLAPLFQELFDDYKIKSDFGALATNVPGVQFFWSLAPIPRSPLVYNAGIFIIGQGYKIGYLGERKFRYDEDTYLILGVPLPFECETYGPPEEPVLGIQIDINITTLHELIAKLGGRVNIKGDEIDIDPHSAVEPAPMSKAMIKATESLLACLRDPIDSKVLGSAAVNEVIYRVLRSEQGQVLYNLTQYHTPYAAVARALNRIHREYQKTLTVDDLARENAMSLSSFHRAFKKVTGNSPMQYLKKIRLDKAKGLLIYNKAQVNTAAYEVGYESPSQFSREFKRYFKIPPSEVSTYQHNPTT